MSQSYYVVAAYLVVFVTVLVYVAIIASKLQRLERETAELAELARDHRGAGGGDRLAERLARGARRLSGQSAGTPA